MPDQPPISAPSHAPSATRRAGWLRMLKWAAATAVLFAIADGLGLPWLYALALAALPWLLMPKRAD